MGSTGRGPWFSNRARASVCRTVADVTARQTLLIGGCMATGLDGMLEHAHVLADSGANMVAVTAPGYFSYSQQEVENLLSRFADASPLPVMLYDIPIYAQVKLDLDVILRLATHENVVGLKDSSADWNRFKELTLRFGHLPNFFLLQGKESLLAESLLCGASGFVASLVQINPRLFVALWQAHERRDTDRLFAIQAQITSLLRAVDECFARRPETSTLFHFLNYVLRARGLCENILLDHEGDCPEWLAQSARQAMAFSAERN